MEKHTWDSPGYHKETRTSKTEEFFVFTCFCSLMYFIYCLISAYWPELIEQINIIRDESEEDLVQFTSLLTLYGAIGVIATWRYLNLAWNYSNAAVYLWCTFPRLKSHADIYRGVKNKQLGIVFTAYGKSPQIIENCIVSLLKEIDNYGVDSVLTIAVTKGKQGDIDKALIYEIIHRIKIDNAHIYLNVFKQDGSGKRSAMAECLTYLKTYKEIDYVVILDGDTIVDDGIFGSVIPYFNLRKENKKIGALTVNNKVYAEGSSWFTSWVKLRFFNRHIDLSSCLCVLTGRFSVYDARIVLQERFIHRLQNHYVKSPFNDVVKALSGDDKTGILEVLDQGYEVLYIPDCYIYSMEDLQEDTTADWKNYWWYATMSLTKRYSGNMLLIAGEILSLGIPKIGWRRWIKLQDQRLAFWTPLSGPIGAIITALKFHWIIIPIWILWMMITRLFHSLVIGLFNKYWSAFFPVILPHVQIIGSAIKTKRLPNLNIQNWNNQGISQGVKENITGPITLVVIIVMIIYTLLSLQLGE